MSSTLKSSGGQIRTTTAPCGYVIRKHPKEANGIMKIHTRNCEHCLKVLDGKKLEIPEFNKVNGKLNGWKGLKHNGKKTDNYISVAFNLSTGEESTFGCETNTLEKAIEQTRDKVEAKKVIKDETIFIESEIDRDEKCYWCNARCCDGYQIIIGSETAAVAVHNTCI